MNSPRIGVLIAQLGTPDAPTAPALRRYLRQFLSDPRLIELNRIAWWLILNLRVLPFRPARSAALYQRVWTEKGSPLLLTSLEQGRALEAALDSVLVEVGMRYGNPSLPSALDRLSEKGADRILVFPMFPQYAAATTASIFDAVGDHLRHRRVIPALRFVPPYFKHPAYIDALATVAREELSRFSWKPDKLVISFHGVPKSHIDRGDVYRLHAEGTTCLLAEALGLKPDDYELCFQSRFGREE